MVVRQALRSSAFPVLAGNAAYALSQFVALLLIHRYDSSAALGQYSLALAVTAPIALLFDLKLRTIQVTDSLQEYDPRQYTTLRWLTTTAYVTILVGVGIAMSGTLGSLVSAVAVFKGFESLNDLYFGYLQRRQSFASVCKVQILRSAVFVGVWFVVLSQTGDTVRAAWVNAVALSFIAAFTGYKISLRGFSAFPDRAAAGMVGPLARRAFPVGVSVTLGSLLVNVPRYFISDRLGAEPLAHYAVVSYVLVATSLIAQGLAEAHLPRLADDAASPDRPATAFVRDTIRLCVLGLSIGLCGAALSALVAPTALALAFGPEFGGESSTLVLLLVAAAVQYCALYLGVAINALRIFAIEFPVNLVGVAILTAASWMMIRTSLLGAAFAVLVSQLAILTGYAVIFWRIALPRLAARKSPSA